MEIGKTLKDKRMDKGCSLKDIEDATKIRSKYLKALEDENFNALPGRVYGKAFLRTYARFLGIDGDNLVRAFDELFPQERVTQKIIEANTFEAKKETGFKKYLVYMVSLLLIVGLMYTFNSLKNNMGKEKAQDTNEKGFLIGDNNPEQQEENPLDSDGILQENEKQTLVLKVVSKKCWIEVFSDDQIAYRQTAYEGEILEFEAENGFNFTLGDAGTVEVTVNGEDYGFLGNSGEVIHYPKVLEGGGE